jgi:hypothetical protein
LQPSSVEKGRFMAHGVGTATGTAALRRVSVGAAIAVVVQAGVGIVVNLYVTVPDQHPGAHAENYLSGVFRSVVWAIGHGGVSLAVHAVLGLALVLMALSVIVRAVALGDRRIAVTSVLGALLVIGAGFNGASFLAEGGKAISSLLMALLAFGAICCYILNVYILSGPRPADSA